MRTTRILLSLGVLLATADLFLFKAPHLRLALGLAAGEVDGRPIPVDDFSPAQFTGKTVPISCGSLLFDVPESTEVEMQPNADNSMLWLRSAGAVYHVFAPARETGVEEDLLKDTEWGRAFGNDEIAQRLELYRSNSGQLSFWLSVWEAQALEDKLDIRRAFCSSADRIEVLRGPNLSGFVFFRTIEGTQHVEFDYFCGGQPLRGRIFITLNPSQAAAIDEVRAFLCSLRFDESTTRLPAQSEPAA